MMGVVSVNEGEGGMGMVAQQCAEEVGMGKEGGEKGEGNRKRRRRRMMMTEERGKGGEREREKEREG